MISQFNIMVPISMNGTRIAKWAQRFGGIFRFLGKSTVVFAASAAVKIVCVSSVSWPLLYLCLSTSCARCDLLGHRSNNSHTELIYWRVFFWAFRWIPAPETEREVTGSRKKQYIRGFRGRKWIIDKKYNRMDTFCIKANVQTTVTHKRKSVRNAYATALLWCF